MKYKTHFDFPVKLSGKQISSARKNVSSASLKNLKDLADIEVASYERLVPVAFDLAVINQFNRNGDGTDTEGAIKIARTLPNQPINIEHDRYNICGHTINVGFRSRADRMPLKDEELNDQPYYLSVGGILYTIVSSGLVDFIRWSNEDDEMQLSASWEVAFDEYDIMVGSNLLAKCETIDEAKKEEYAKFLSCNGGNGFDDEGRPVFRKIKGEVESVGIGLTLTPAADVKGIFTLPKEELEKSSEDGDEDDSNASNKKTENNFSLSPKIDVIANREQNMTLEQLLAEIKTAIAAKPADSSKEDIISVASETSIKLIDEAVKATATKFAEEKNTLTRLKEEAEAKAKSDAELAEKVKTKLQEMETQLIKANDQLAALQKAEAENAKASKMDGIMAEFDAKFSMSDAERKIVLAELGGTDLSDAAIEGFKSKYDTLFASKLKSQQGTTAEEELAKASAKGAAITDSQPASQKLSDKLSKIKLNVKIS